MLCSLCSHVMPYTCPRPNTPTHSIGVVYFSLINYLFKCIVAVIMVGEAESVSAFIKVPLKNTDRYLS